MTTTDISVNNPTLQELKKRKQRFGSLGALDFLITYEETKNESERLSLLRQHIHVLHKSQAIEIKSAKTNIKSSKQKKKPCDKVNNLRTKLLGLGFTEKPLEELETIARNDPNKEQRAKAAQIIALWHLRVNTPDSCQKALTYINLAHPNATPRMLLQLAVAEMLCHAKLDNLHSAQKLFNSLQKNQQLTPDLWLAWTNFQKSEEDRVSCINQALAIYNVPPVALMPQRPGQNLPSYDRLTAVTTPPAIYDGPKVTVLVAAYNCSDTLPTCLRSLEQQSWKNLEVLVLDDHSPTLETFEIAQAWAAKDSRFKAIRMSENGGAYVARNHGLSIATGEFVTLHDADDWSHPLKIETQIQYLMKHPHVVGCRGMQARCHIDIRFRRWSGVGKLVMLNTSSFMFRRLTVVNTVGYWDTVRLSADSEFIDRIRFHSGKGAVATLTKSVHSLQRYSDTSMIANDYLGIHQMAYGARLLYKQLQMHSHEKQIIYYRQHPKFRPFPVPRVMLMKSKEFRKCKNYDVVIASDFTLKGGSGQSCLQEILCHKKMGLKTALLPMYRYDLAHPRSFLDKILDQIDGETIDILAYGDNVSCDVLIVRYPPVLEHQIRYIPDVVARDIRVIVNQSPMSDYGPNGVVRYELKACAENIRHYFGKDATWHPIGPQVRSALLEHHAEELKHICLADWDWSNIIDLDKWSDGSHKHEIHKKLRIGRHSRDHVNKWPEDKHDLLAAYPDSNNVEVHILGGAASPIESLGYYPRNWIVHKFGSMRPKDFLFSIDIFIYFTSTHLVEAFGRSILEAMAAGVPVILPNIYQPLFKEAALYATSQTAVSLARELHANPQKYNEQVHIAQEYVRKHFSYQTHLNRLQNLGVDIPVLKQNAAV